MSGSPSGAREKGRLPGLDPSGAHSRDGPGRMPRLLSPWAAIGLGLIGVGGAGAARAAMGAGAGGDLAFLVSLDERALGPFVLHEPLVAAGVGGALVGRLTEGVFLGLSLQWIWPGLRPLGGARQPSAGLAALIGVAWYLLLPDAIGPWRFPVALGAAVAGAAWGRAGEELLRGRNALREARVGRDGRPLWSGESLIAAGAAEALARGVLASALFFAFPLVLLRLGAAASTGASGALPSAPPPGAESWSDLMPPEAAAAAVWFFAAGGLLRQALGAWRRTGRGAAAAAGPAGATEPGAGGGTAGVEAIPGVGARTLGADEGEPEAFPRGVRPRLWIPLLLLQSGFSRAFQQRSGFRNLAESLGRSGSGPARARAVALAGDLAGGAALNTHPGAAAALAGALVRLLHASRQGAPERPLARLLEVGGAALAQWADRAFWGAGRPLLALAAMALAPVAPAASLVSFVIVGLGLELGVRNALWAWGARAGWAVVSGLPGRFWRALPVWGSRLQVPAILLALVVLAAMAGFDSDRLAWAMRLGWFMLGGLAGSLATRRVMLWGWMCWGVSLTAAILAAGVPGWAK
jgi:hypothetical protein